ncbi:MAG: hypothetical protein M1831_005145 [Alyxoria varia]|nr:MAG: hypothetical protein M1831_005145 [Alyxoria varia]
MKTDGLFTLLSFSLVMGVASFLAGYLPLTFNLSQKHSRIISSVGTGLLVGTCLIIIIPEGIETLYSASAPHVHSHSRRDDSDDEPLQPQESERSDPHAFIGLALIAGFIMMYLIHQLPQHASSSSPQKPLHISLANLSQGPHRAVSPSRVDEGESADDFSEASPAQQSFATTIGLVIHAAADGIALAASSFIEQSGTGFVVFLALMIHKAPAAFGLTSVLLKQGFTKRQARAHLLIFSLAAPLGAIATWALVNLIAGGQLSEGQTNGENSTRFWTGLLLLFSAGTFLYVSMHTMQETGSEHHEQSSSNGYIDGNAYATSRARRDESSKPQARDTMFAVMGMLLPLLAQAGHAH